MEESNSLSNIDDPFKEWIVYFHGYIFVDNKNMPAWLSTAYEWYRHHRSELIKLQSASPKKDVSIHKEKMSAAWAKFQEITGLQAEAFWDYIEEIKSHWKDGNDNLKKIVEGRAIRIMEQN